MCTVLWEKKMTNNKFLIATAVVLLATSSAWGASRSREKTEAAPAAKPAATAVQPGKVQIQGNTNINAKTQNNSAIAVGEGNSAKNSTGAIRSGTQIKGNTNLNASSKNSTAVAVGKGNSAVNQAGTIGGN